MVNSNYRCTYRYNSRGGSNLWGYGKINAYAAVKKTWQSVNVNNIANAGLDYMIYPNPNDGRLSIDYIAPSKEAINIGIYDICGKLIYSDKWNVATGYNNMKSDISIYGKGIYFIKLNSSQGSSAFKLVVE